MTGPGSEGVRDVGAMMRPEESATAPDAPRAKRRRTDTVIGNNDAGAIGTAINQGAAATDTVMGLSLLLQAPMVLRAPLRKATSQRLRVRC